MRGRTLTVTFAFLALATVAPANELPIDDFHNDWITKHLRALKEPYLQDATADPSNEIYRLVALPTFDHPVSVRVTALSSGAAAATIRRTTGKGGYEPGILASERAVRMTTAQLASLRTAMSDGFAKLPTVEPEERDEKRNLVERITCTDGTLVVLEAVRVGTYHLVVRSCTYERAVADAVDAFKPFLPPEASEWLPLKRAGVETPEDRSNGSSQRRWRMIKAEESSGNVFRDLGFANADEMLAKAELARQAGKLIKRLGLTQAEVANLLKIDQPKVSALLNGRLTAFSTARLMRFLKALGQDVRIVVKPRPRSRAAQIRVAAE